MYLSGPPPRLPLPPLVHTISACLREMDLVGVASRTTEHILELRPSVVVSLIERNSNSNRRTATAGSACTPRGIKVKVGMAPRGKEGHQIKEGFLLAPFLCFALRCLGGTRLLFIVGDCCSYLAVVICNRHGGHQELVHIVVYMRILHRIRVIYIYIYFLS